MRAGMGEPEDATVPTRGAALAGALAAAGNP